MSSRQVKVRDDTDPIQCIGDTLHLVWHQYQDYADAFFLAVEDSIIRYPDGVIVEIPHGEGWVDPSPHGSDDEEYASASESGPDSEVLYRHMLHL